MNTVLVLFKTEEELRKIDTLHQDNVGDFWKNEEDSNYWTKMNTPGGGTRKCITQEWVGQVKRIWVGALPRFKWGIDKIVTKEEYPECFL